MYLLLMQTDKIEMPQIIFEDIKDTLEKSLKGFVGEEETIKGCDES